MKYLKFLSVGVLFGIIMTKSEAISWYRIQEMFLFDSFHMYGIIGTAVVAGLLVTTFIKRKQLQTIEGEKIKLNPKNMSIPRYLLGGTVFGLGWALTGACPGPMYTLLGHGIAAILVVIISSLIGTLVYGILRPKLPH
mgnify:FL=1|jgi:uncharacterized membrane protein YedE/YeeE